MFYGIMKAQAILLFKGLWIKILFMEEKLIQVYLVR